MPNNTNLKRFNHDNYQHTEHTTQMPNWQSIEQGFHCKNVCYVVTAGGPYVDVSVAHFQMPVGTYSALLSKSLFTHASMNACIL